MKICVFCHDSYDSGANLSLYDWVNGDNENKFYIFIPRENKDIIKNFKNQNVKIIVGHYFVLVKELHSTSFIYKIKKSIKMVYMAIFKRMIMNKIKKNILDIKADAIISNSFSTTIGAEIANELDISHYWHIREFMELDHKITHYNKKKISYLCSHSNAIFISDVIKKYYLERETFKSNAVIYDQVQYDESASHKIRNDNCFKILMAGTLSDNKGQFDAINAVMKVHEKNANVILDLYGKGPNEKKISKYLTDNNINYINLKGYATDLTKIRSEYDATLVCSKSEALGRVTIEGMYYENLVIGSNSGCTAILVKDGYNGLLYSNGDVNDLADKIEYCMNNKSKTTEIVNNAKLYAIDNFSHPVNDKIINFIMSTKTRRGAIITITDNDNFGNRLQNYAVEKILNIHNILPYTIWLRYYNSLKFKIKNMIKAILPMKKYPTLSRMYNFKKFTNNYTHKYFSDYSKSIADNFDYVFVGSDQVFSVGYYDRIKFIADVTSDNVIALSPSFGSSNLTDENKGKYKNILKKFKKMSVRENEGKSIINDILPDKNVEVLLDPTMVLSKKMWDEVSKKPKNMKNKKHILLYFLGGLTEEQNRMIQDIAKKYDYMIIDVLNRKSKYYNIGPSEFVYLVKEAAIVYTDSYHACAFSIIYNIPFVVFNRNNSSFDMSSRITTLLTIFELKERKYNNSNLEELLECDYAKTNAILEQKKLEFEDYINNI